MWIQTALYYCEHFEIINSFNKDDAISIETAQKSSNNHIFKLNLYSPNRTFHSYQTQLRVLKNKLYHSSVLFR